MEKAYPEVAFETPVERLSTFITKENGAVLSKDESGSFSYCYQIRHHPKFDQIIIPLIYDRLKH